MILFIIYVIIQTKNIEPKFENIRTTKTGWLRGNMNIIRYELNYKLPVERTLKQLETLLKIL